MVKSIYPCLWFNGNAKEAAEYYCQIFQESRMLETTELVVRFELKGQSFMGLNGGPLFAFNEAVSFVIECDDQEEIDYYWHKLSSGGATSQCGWLKDKFGVSWQVVPSILASLMANPETAATTMKRFMTWLHWIILNLAWLSVCVKSIQRW
ncbi:MAG: VOC family protein [Saprospiraceae bacterium]|nr:VOC family protein [Saprospiraceae bacterium]